MAPSRDYKSQRDIRAEARKAYECDDGVSVKRDYFEKKAFLSNADRSFFADTARDSLYETRLPDGGYVSPNGSPVKSRCAALDGSSVLTEDERFRQNVDYRETATARRRRFIGPFPSTPSTRTGVIGCDDGLLDRPSPFALNGNGTTRSASRTMMVRGVEVAVPFLVGGGKRVECGDISKVKNATEQTKAFVSERYAALFNRDGPQLAQTPAKPTKPYSYEPVVYYKPEVKPRLLAKRKADAAASRAQRTGFYVCETVLSTLEGLLKRSETGRKEYLPRDYREVIRGLGMVAFRKGNRQYTSKSIAVVDYTKTGYYFFASQYDRNGDWKQSFARDYFTCEGSMSPMEQWYADNPLETDLKGELYFAKDSGSVIGSKDYSHVYDWMVEPSNLRLVRNGKYECDYSYWSSERASRIARQEPKAPKSQTEASYPNSYERWMKKTYDAKRYRDKRSRQTVEAESLGVRDLALLKRIRDVAAKSNRRTKKATRRGYVKFVGGAGAVWNAEISFSVKVPEDEDVLAEVSVDDSLLDDRVSIDQIRVDSPVIW